MAVDRRTRWLGGAMIAALVALMAVRSMDDDSTAASARPAAAPRGRMAEGEQGSAAPTADVNLGALTRTRGEPATQGRNPFRFQAKAPPPAPVLAPAPNETTEALPVVPAGPPPPPPIPLKFIGLVEKADGTKIAVLSDGRRPHSGVEGQEIDGRYRILKIGNESIEMVYIDGRGRQTIRLSGQ
ncbi:MAG: hypothetical protein ACRD1H_13755 [Vicinamibacterales bacterium]